MEMQFKYNYVLSLTAEEFRTVSRALQRVSGVELVKALTPEETEMCKQIQQEMYEKRSSLVCQLADQVSAKK